MASIVTTGTVSMKKLYAYDDHGSVEGKEGAAIFIYFNTGTGIPECPSSVYLSPKSPGYKNLVAFSLTAYVAKSPVRFQVYNDAPRLLSGRCEVDAVRLE